MKKVASHTKVLFVVNDSQFFLSHWQKNAHAAQAAGYNIVVLAPDRIEQKRIEALGFSFDFFYLRRWHPSLFSELQTLVSLLKLFRKHKPLMVHHVTIKPVIFGSMAAYLAGIPAIVNYVSGLGYIFVREGFFSLFRRRLVILLYRLAFRGKFVTAIFENEDDRSLFCKHVRLPKHKTVIIRGAGINLSEFEICPEPEGIPVITMVSRLLVDKGIGEYVEAARILKKRGIKARFVHVGPAVPENPAGVKMETLEAWKAERTVEFLGKLDDMPALVRATTITCLPSYREGLPKALLEGAAGGRPIVTTDVPGCREVVRHGHNGLLVPARDANSLADALETLITNPTLRRQMGSNSRRLVEEGGFSEEVVIEQTLAVYQGLLG